MEFFPSKYNIYKNKYIYIKESVLRMFDLPIYTANIQSETDGLIAISLVDYPAVESDFVAFEKQQPLTFSIEDEEEHKITGVIMRCDYPIYRNSLTMGEYYIVYKKETIETMCQKMLKDGTFKNIDLQHDGQYIEGVELLEVYIKNSEKGIDPKGFEHISDYSMFGTFKVENEQIWKQIKDEEFAGFSLEGYFEVEKDTNFDVQKEDVQKEDEPDENKKCKLSKDNYILQSKIKKYTNNKMIKKIKKFARIICKFGQVETDKGAIYWEGDADLAVGDEVYQEIEGDRVKAEDGDFKTEDGIKITVEGGLVTYIGTEAEMEDETPAEEEIVTIVEDVVEDVIEEKIEDAVEDVVEVVEEEIYDAKAEIDALKAEVEDLKAKLEELLKEPAAEPIVDEYARVTKQNVNKYIPKFGSKSRTVGI